MRNTQRLLLLFLAAIVLDSFLWISIVSDLSTHTSLTLDFLDVGQGDAQLVTFPGGARIMIDSGPPGGLVARKLDQVLGETDGYIDLAVITHPELDHFGGYRDVLEQYRVGAFIVNGREKDTDEWRHFTEELKESEIPVVTLKEGDRIIYGESRIEILAPSGEFIQSAALNDTGIVMKLASAGVRALFTADIGENVEEYLLPRYDLDVDILKVGHHGSKFSTSEKFLEEVTPRVAVIQAGRENRYGHPTPEVIARLDAVGVKVFRNDRDGTVELTVADGKIYGRSF